MILLDTSGVFAYLDPKDPQHERVRAVLVRSQPPRLLSPFVLAELDYLVSRRIGQQAELLLLEDVSIGAYTLEPFGSVEIARARHIIADYADMDIGLADASIVVLAERYSHFDVLTLDEHFRVLLAGGHPFRMLPADA